METNVRTTLKPMMIQIIISLVIGGLSFFVVIFLSGISPLGPSLSDLVNLLITTWFTFLILNIKEIIANALRILRKAQRRQHRKTCKTLITKNR